MECHLTPSGFWNITSTRFLECHLTLLGSWKPISTRIFGTLFHPTGLLECHLYQVLGTLFHPTKLLEHHLMLPGLTSSFVEWVQCGLYLCLVVLSFSWELPVLVINLVLKKLASSFFEILETTSENWLGFKEIGNQTTYSVLTLPVFTNLLTDGFQGQFPQLGYQHKDYKNWDFFNSEKLK